jgi:hypothetical protein
VGRSGVNVRKEKLSRLSFYTDRPSLKGKERKFRRLTALEDVRFGIRKFGLIIRMYFMPQFYNHTNRCVRYSGVYVPQTRRVEFQFALTKTLARLDWFVNRTTLVFYQIWSRWPLNGFDVSPKGTECALTDFKKLMNISNKIKFASSDGVVQ